MDEDEIELIEDIYVPRNIGSNTYILEKKYIKKPSTKADLKHNLELIMIDTDLDRPEYNGSIKSLSHDVFRLAKIVENLVDKHKDGSKRKKKKNSVKRKKKSVKKLRT